MTFYLSIENLAETHSVSRGILPFIIKEFIKLDPSFFGLSNLMTMAKLIHWDSTKMIFLTAGAEEEKD